MDPASNNEISTLFTRENITFILAFIGSIGTISGWAYSFATSRKNIAVNVIAYKVRQDKALFYLSFTNKSRLPISITALSVQINGVYYPCRHIPQKVVSTQRAVNGKIVSSYDYFSIQIPIEIGSLGSTSGYVLFVLPKGVYIPDSKALNLQISSNRGKAIEMKLTLDQTKDIL
ncbi:hypothetical protein [Clostridium sp. FS41]|uniref:hypothetical protein n=1 Tax=Clostridium sp. FS41 TaxID=1609975 RepID=UPI0005D3A0E2|nr:hypothetical protein [Clostridium sp. FS41]KJJ77622.1 hypothetical protein CLFS41_03020 [Clostridium sp. FS41]